MLKVGAPLKARILDVSKKDGVVDLSLRPVHTAAAVKKAAKALAAFEASAHSCSYVYTQTTLIPACLAGTCQNVSASRAMVSLCSLLLSK